MRIARALAPLVALVAAAAPTGAQAPPVAVFAVTAAPGPVRDVIGEEVAQRPGAGRYFLLDRGGLRCEARLVRSRSLESSMLVAGPAPHQVELRAMGPCGTASVGSEILVAVGPLARRPTRGRLLAIGLALAGSVAGSIPPEPLGAAPPDGVTEGFELAVDLDGDRAADLLSRQARRALPARRGSLRIEHHRETWARSGGWTRTIDATWVIESPID